MNPTPLEYDVPGWYKGVATHDEYDTSNRSLVPLNVERRCGFISFCVAPSGVHNVGGLSRWGEGLRQVPARAISTGRAPADMETAVLRHLGPPIPRGSYGPSVELALKPSLSSGESCNCVAEPDYGENRWVRLRQGNTRVESETLQRPVVSIGRDSYKMLTGLSAPYGQTNSREFPGLCRVAFGCLTTGQQHEQRLGLGMAREAQQRA